ncbi:MAG: hypothetical protein ACQEVA_01965 [Myxococcota bacterium]
MKMTVKLMMLLLIAGGLTLSACKKGDEKKADDEKAETEEPTEEEAEQEAEEEEPAEEEEAEVDRDNYIEAAYQVACVEKTIEDVEKRKDIKTEIYARFGFDEESYTAASEALADDEAVKAAVETRMEKCTKEIAEGFAKAGEEGEEAAEGEEKKEAKKKPAAPKPAATGTFNGELSGGIEKGTIKLRIKDDFSVSGTARLTAEGKTQPVAVRGKVSDDKTTVSASGDSGNTDIKVSGAIKGGNVMGSVSGTVYGKNFKSKFTATK